MKTLPAIVLGLFLLSTHFMSGCAQLTGLLDKSDEEAARFVNQWCDNTDQAFRDERRQSVNAHAAPDEIIVNCAPRIGS